MTGEVKEGERESVWGERAENPGREVKVGATKPERHESAVGHERHESARKPEHPNVALDLVLIVCMFFLGQFTGAYLGMAARNVWGISPEMGNFVAYTSGMILAVGGGLLVRSLGSGRKLSKRYFRIGTPHSAIILWGIVASIAISVVAEPLVDLMPDRYLELLYRMLGRGSWVILTTVVAAPILEEILFRGIIQEEAMRRWGGFWGILIASIIFAAIHIIPPQAVGAFFVALVIGYVFMRTRSLLAVMVIHAVNNILAYLQMTVSNSPAATVRDLVGSTGWYWLLYIVSALFVAISAVVITTGHLRRVHKARLRTHSDETQQ